MTGLAEVIYFWRATGLSEACILSGHGVGLTFSHSHGIQTTGNFMLWLLRAPWTSCSRQLSSAVQCLLHLPFPLLGWTD